MKWIIKLFSSLKESGIIHKELTQCLRSRIFIGSNILLLLFNIGLYFFNLFFELEQVYFLLLGAFQIAVYSCLTQLWSIWISAREYQEGNFLSIELSGKRPAYIILHKLASFLLFSLLGCFIILPYTCLFYFDALRFFHVSIFFIILTPLLWIPSYLFSLSCCFIQKSYLRYLVLLASIGSGGFLFLGSSMFLLEIYLREFFIYGISFYIILSLFSFFVAAQSLSSDYDSYIGELKLTGCLLIALFLSNPKLPALFMNAEEELSWFIHILFISVYLLGYSTEDHIPRFTEIRARRNRWTSIVHNYFGPGRRNNLRFFILLCFAVLSTASSNMVDALLLHPHILEVFIYVALVPILNTLIHAILKRTSVQNISEWGIKILIVILMGLGLIAKEVLRDVILYGHHFNPISKQSKYITYGILAFTSLLVLLADHYEFHPKWNPWKIINRGKKKEKKQKRPSFLHKKVEW